MLEAAKWYAQSVKDGALGPHGVQTYAVLLGSWTVFCAVYALLFRTGRFEHLRCQPAEKTSGKLFWDGCRDSAVNWAGLAVVMPLSAPFLSAMFPSDIPFPGPLELLKFVAFSVCVFDVWFYMYHRYLHENPALYRAYHKPHHHYTATFVWMSHAQHPVELMLNSVGAVGGPLAFSFLVCSEPSVGIHLFWFWLAFVQFFGVTDHCGYDLGISPLFVFHFPWLLDTRDHDEHHRRLTVSYGAVFKVWDWLGGTCA